MGVAQLAIAYCDALVDDGGLRDAFFGSVDFNNFNTPAMQIQIIDALYNETIAVDISGSSCSDGGPSRPLCSAPTHGEISTELTNLYGRLCTAPCDATRSRKVLKGMCASVLGSATMLIQ